MRRREFITLLGGVAAAWPLAAWAQQAQRARRVAVLMGFAESDPEGQARAAALQQALQKLGWTDGRNIRIDYRWGAGDADRLQVGAAELIGMTPDVVASGGATALAAVLKTTRIVPIVFVGVTDPVGAGFVESLAHPGGNATGFTQFEYGISGKWLELLKQIAPRMTRAAIIRDATVAGGIGQLAAIQSVASSLGVELSPVGVRDAREIERGVSTFARGPDGGLIVVSGASTARHRDLIITLAARYRLPAVYPFRYYVTSGALMSYGPDTVDPYRQAAGYIDRILKGEKPASLPVQAPTKYELVINLKTAKALGLEIPPTLLARADEVIE
jgi:putative tryptophan/tyrosine transport system substrate-binding protein